MIRKGSPQLVHQCIIVQLNSLPDALVKVMKKIQRIYNSEICPYLLQNERHPCRTKSMNNVSTNLCQVHYLLNSTKWKSELTRWPSRSWPLVFTINQFNKMTFSIWTSHLHNQSIQHLSGKLLLICLFVWLEFKVTSTQKRVILWLVSKDGERETTHT